ncbi:MAG: 3-hydroxyacyl-CoA dehydrogenase [Peptoniphilus sp.]|nr:3-hydroxyacyl-CoA dehydrogenase [Peptoniphilus sp.]MDD7362659.1 3-hydroxyacyl-CoA dehydrogenase [Bacillota bacterium]MDY6044942.1 3-hydroxyacyl-CoA dehydrogenase [Peptoniphilus sp.]
MEFKKVVVLGGGVLGTQIALMSAYTGHDTTIWLRSEGSIERTQPRVDHYTETMVQVLEDSKELIGNPLSAKLYPRGLIREWDGTTEDDIDRLIEKAKQNFRENLNLELNIEAALGDADITIEAMSEDPEAKSALYKNIRDVLDEKTILCTNSSTLLPSTFAEDTGRPEKYMALHFANEIWRHNTAECMGHPGTDPGIYDTVVRFAEEMNMIPIKLHKEQPAYVLNSLLVPFLDSAEALWAKGVADPETIDLTWRLATGAPAGPFEILDVVGLDTVYKILQMKSDVNDSDSIDHKIGAMIKEKIDRGEKGVSSGKGFYTYETK